MYKYSKQISLAILYSIYISARVANTLARLFYSSTISKI